MSTTISVEVIACIKKFRSLASISAEKSEYGSKKPEWKIVDELSRLKVWSANIGAHQRGKSSLDYRLRDASHLAAQVIDLLEDLEASLDDAYCILGGTKIPWDQELLEDESDDESISGLGDEGIGFVTEMEQISADVAEVINCLMNLSVSIQNPAPHDRFLGSTDTNASFFESKDISHVQDKWKKVDVRLATILGKANTRRRQYFRYRESHHQKLAQNLDVDFDTGESFAEGQSTVASSIPYVLKAGHWGPAANVDVDELSDSGFTQTSYASSAKTSDRPRFPALHSISTTVPFECPFCFMMINVTTSFAWRKHIFADLRPYSCVAVDCPIAGSEFGRRRQWMQHVLQNHWCEWRCMNCAHEPFTSMSSFRHHLEYHHVGMIPTDELETAVKLCEHPRPLGSETECPFCHCPLRSAKAYRNHVGRHLEDIALFVLPQILVEAELSDDVKMTGSSSDIDSFDLNKDDNELELEETAEQVAEKESEGQVSTMNVLEYDTIDVSQRQNISLKQSEMRRYAVSRAYINSDTLSALLESRWPSIDKRQFGIKMRNEVWKYYAPEKISHAECKEFAQERLRQMEGK